MLLGFLIRSEDEWKEWRRNVSAPAAEGEEGRKAKPIVHVHDVEPSYNSGGAGEAGKGEREGAVDEVQSCDESDDETVVC